jgi:uncharacterized membrane protein
MQAGSAVIIAAAGLRRAAALAAVAFALPVCAEEAGCPPVVAVDQLARPPGGRWEAGAAGMAASLTGVRIHDGPPRAGSALEPSRRQDLPDQQVEQWTLPANPRGYWIECAYASPTPVLRRKLPSEVSRCELRKPLRPGSAEAGAVRVECAGGSAGATPAPPQKVVRGLLAPAAEGFVLTRCGSTRAQPVRDGTGGALRGAHARVMEGGDGTMFVEASAASEPESEGLVLTALRRAEREGPGCALDLSRVRFRAVGSEPYWSIEVGPEQAELRSLAMPAGFPERMTFAYAPPKVGPEATVYTFRSALDRLRLTLRPGLCVEPMSGAWFAWKAEAALDGRRYTGCALEGDLAR